MRDETVEGTPRTHSGALLAAIAVALLLGLGGMIWSYTLSSKLALQQQAVTDALSGKHQAERAALQYDTDAHRLRQGWPRDRSWKHLRSASRSNNWIRARRRYNSARLARRSRQHG